MSLVSDLGYRLRAATHRGNFKKRYDVINYFARRHRARRYLEIGTRGGRTMKRVQVAHKVGVDPNPGEVRGDWTVCAQTSDDFFRERALREQALREQADGSERFELIFVDGLHLCEQVVRDIWNGLAALAPRGAMLLHDCNPLTAGAASRDESLGSYTVWNGDVWKAVAFFRQRQPEIFCRVLDLDHGIGVILPSADAVLAPLDARLEAEAASSFAGLGFADLEARRGELLGLVPDRATLEREMRQAGV